MREVNELHRDIVEEMFKGYDFDFNVVSYGENEFRFEFESHLDEYKNIWVYIILENVGNSGSKRVYVKRKLKDNAILGWYRQSYSEDQRFLLNNDFWIKLFLEHLR